MADYANTNLTLGQAPYSKTLQYAPVDVEQFPFSQYLKIKIS